jgi:putative ABC transport system permease protein
MNQRKRMLADLENDIRLHIETETQENIDRGMSPEEAHRAAMRKFGNVTRVIEDTREVWSVAWLERLLQDLHYGFRMLPRSPSFAFAAVLSLALGIGANTAIFSVIDAVLLKALPVQEPSRLVQLEQTYKGEGYNFFSYPTYLRLRDSNRVFSDLFGWAIRRMSGSFGDQVEPMDAMLVTGNYFPGLGVQPLVGRTIFPSDDLPSSLPVAVLSYNTWQKRYGGEANVIGRTVILERIAMTVIGVTPRGFSGTEVGRSFEVAIPISLQPRLNPDRPFLDRVDAQWIRLMARLAPNVAGPQARAQCAILWPRIVGEVDPKGVNGVHNFGLRLDAASTGISELRREFSRPLLVLLAIAALVLLIASANVANLLLARAATRRREVALRFALGASRWRVIRQTLVESVILAALGSVAGLIFAVWGARALVGLLSVGVFDRVTLNVTLDWRILAFTAIAAFFSALLFGSIPAFGATSNRLESALCSSGRTLGGGRRNASKALVVIQVAISLPLLLAAGLFARSLDQLLSVDPGFHRQGVLMLHMNPARTGYKGPALANLYGDLLQRTSAVPGVRYVSLSTYPPLTGGGGTFFSASNISIDGRSVAADTRGNVYFNQIGPQFFDTLAASLVAGRDFTADDNASAQQVIIISQALALALFPGQSPLGHYVQVGTHGRAAEIVGVAKDMKYETLRESPHYVIFEPYLQDLDAMGSVYLEVRSDSTLTSVESAVRQQIASTYPQVALEPITLTDWVNHFLINDRIVASLAGVFGTLAMVLAAVGLYGVMTYGVTQRTGEIGVRMALGAKKESVLGLIMGEAAILVLLGLATGLPLALALGRTIASMLFNLSPSNPPILLGGAAILAMAALVAAYLPARRAAGVDPTTALRVE